MRRIYGCDECGAKWTDQELLDVLGEDAEVEEITAVDGETFEAFLCPECGESLRLSK